MNLHTARRPHESARPCLRIVLGMDFLAELEAFLLQPPCEVIKPCFGSFAPSWKIFENWKVTGRCAHQSRCAHHWRICGLPTWISSAAFSVLRQVEVSLTKRVVRFLYVGFLSSSAPRLSFFAVTPPPLYPQGHRSTLSKSAGDVDAETNSSASINHSQKDAVESCSS